MRKISYKFGVPVRVFPKPVVNVRHSRPRKS